MERVLLTGGAGFIGSCVARRLVDAGKAVVTLDLLTYAGHTESLGAALDAPNHNFENADIRDRDSVRRIFSELRPDTVLHLAAESHVDRSIDSPMDFVTTNVQGTVTLLEAATAYWSELESEERERFRFLHVSTDEVYGSLGAEGVFTDTTPYQPNSPYSASKAASDHFARAWHRTFGLPVLISHCSNNYGPYQMPEKLVPVVYPGGSGGTGRSPSTATARTCATGFSSKTMPALWIRSLTRECRARCTTSARMRR